MKDSQIPSYSRSAPSVSRRWLTLCLFVLLSSTLIDAIDIGRTIKNIGQNIGGSGGKTDPDIEQQMVDASTGTITSVSPSQSYAANQGQKPVECNEIMAKAVVLASEEKEEAIAARDSAVAIANKAQDRVADLETQIGDALELARNSTIEMEAVKLMTDRLVEESKKKGEKKLLKQKEASQAEIDELNVARETEVKALNAANKAEVDTLNAASEAEVKALIAANKAEVDALNAASKTEITGLNEKIDAIIQQNTELVQSIETSSQLAIAETNLEAENQIDATTKKFQAEKLDLETKTAQQIQQIKSEAKDQVDATQKKYDELTDEMKALKKSTAEQIAAIEEKADIEVNEAKHRFHTREVEILSQADENERRAKDEMDRIKKDANKIVSETIKDATKEYNNVKREANDEVTKIMKSIELKLADIEKEMIKVKADASAKQNELQAVIDSQSNEIASLESSSAALTEELSLKHLEAGYWKQVGEAPTYVNTTLIREDSYVVIDASFQFTKTQVREFMKPYRAVVTGWYARNVQPFLERNILPFHEKHLDAMQKKIQKIISAQIQSMIVPAYNALIDKIYQLANSVFNQLCGAVKQLTGKLLAYLKENSFTLPRAFQAFLEGVEEDPSEVVAIVCSAIITVLTYLLRYLIMSLVFWFAKLHLRVIWYVSPLRLIIGDGKGSAKKVKVKREAVNGFSTAKVNGIKKEL